MDTPAKLMPVFIGSSLADFLRWFNGLFSTTVYLHSSLTTSTDEMPRKLRDGSGPVP